MKLAVDIGGTFTDVALADAQGRLTTAKVLTTHGDPGEGVLAGIARVLEEAGAGPGNVSLILHGTTLATNALIERRGAKTALIVTEGHRDTLAMAYEHRCEQYDIMLDRPVPLVPRELRLPVKERLDKDGKILVPLDEDDVQALAPVLRDQSVESVAIGYLHAYANPAHEQRTAEILSAALPDLWITLASEVCPEIREYERQSTACANAYVRPLMARYLTKLQDALTDRGLDAPFLLMTSGGGLTTLQTAARFPIRLVESGPAGGAILAAHLAKESGIDRLLSFDMGGTTAKLCLIDGGAPLTARSFEIDRVYRFKKGSGLPVRIPVIEMVEIGAGGGSIASVDALKRIQVGPESAGSEPGPAAYGRGGTRPTVTDADALMGKLVPDRFAGGSFALDMAAAETAVAEQIGAPLGLEADQAAFGITEIVDETMAAAARAHAVEWGKEAAGRTMVAFGGAAPLHAARLAQKLGIDRILVPQGAGVGSAIGFLLAPIAYEVVRSRHMPLSAFDAGVVNAVMADMRAEADAVVRAAAPQAEARESRQAYMRYQGQGYEIAVDLPPEVLDETAGQTLRARFEATYQGLYGRTIPDQEIEMLSWTLSLAVPLDTAFQAGPQSQDSAGQKAAQGMFDSGRRARVEAEIIARDGLVDRTAGPALIVEAQTTTVVPAGWTVTRDGHGNLLLQQDPPTQSG